MSAPQTRDALVVGLSCHLRRAFEACGMGKPSADAIAEQACIYLEHPDVLGQPTSYVAELHARQLPDGVSGSGA